MFKKLKSASVAAKTAIVAAPLALVTYVTAAPISPDISGISDQLSTGGTDIMKVGMLIAGLAAVGTVAYMIIRAVRKG